MILIISIVIKTAIDVHKIRKDRKRIERRIEKTIVTSFLAGKDKNKEEKNIKDKK